jgi:hypothetical protein
VRAETTEVLILTHASVLAGECTAEWKCRNAKILMVIDKEKQIIKQGCTNFHKI